MNTLDFISYIQPLKYTKYANACQNMAFQCISIGKGDYGTAFRLNDGFVVKIFQAHDRAYLSFLSMVNLCESKHLPNILCYDIYDKFGWVILEFLDEYTLTQYLNLNFIDITQNMSCIIRGQEPKIKLPPSLTDLALEMKANAEGFCLDFRTKNFALRGAELVIFDPFCNKTNNNHHLDYVERRKSA